MTLVRVALGVSAVTILVFGVQGSTRLVLSAADDFRAGVDRYVELRQQVEGTMPTRQMTADPAEVLGRERAFGAAMRGARSTARQGEIFGAAAVKDFGGIIAADFARRSASDRAAIMTDVPRSSPRVNDQYPATSALATFPALLLEALPRLPEDLEYRFMGDHLIIRDTKSNLIVDYLPGAARGARQ